MSFETPPWYVTVPATVAGMYATAVLFRTLSTKTCTSKALLKGKTVVVTGANTGIGLQTTLELATRHARVVLACRDEAKAQRAIEYVKAKTKNGDLVFKQLDLTSFNSVRKFCDAITKEEKRIDVLINNAGVMNHPFQLTEDGIEMHMAINHYSNFLLTNLLLPKLKESVPSRIVFVSSSLHQRGSIDLENLKGKQTNGYNNSKLANVYFARELNEQLKGSGVSVFTVHPGMVDTDLARHTFSEFAWKLLYPLKLLLIKTPKQGCQTVLHCAVSEELEGKSGGYYGNVKEEPWPNASSDKEVQIKLWNESKNIVGL